MKIEKKFVALFALGVLVLSACSTLSGEQVAVDSNGNENSSSGDDTTEASGAENADAADEGADEEASVSIAPSGYTCADGSDPFEGVLLKFQFQFWPETDFCQSTINYAEVVGVLRADQITPIDSPQFESIADANARIEEQEPVIVFVENDDARAYPLSIMTWHEITNDVVGGRPVTVTFCPLCNAAIVFDRTVDGQELTFGTSGNLRNSDLIMWDRQTQSWWQQFTGESIAGAMAGTQLEFLPSNLATWAAFKEAYPDGQVLTASLGRNYGQNPYSNYDSSSQPFLFVDDDGSAKNVDSRLFATERVLGLILGGESVAYPFEPLAEAGVIADAVAGQDVVVFYQPGEVSALDAGSIANSREVGSAAAYDPVVNGDRLSFSYDSGVITDDQTGSEWNIFGLAVSGSLKGEQLSQMLAYPHFWFAWAAFQPETGIWGT